LTIRDGWARTVQFAAEAGRTALKTIQIRNRSMIRM
jgi:hypothetical protein